MMGFITGALVGYWCSGDTHNHYHVEETKPVVKIKPKLTEEEKRQRSMLGGRLGMMSPEGMEAGNRQMQLINDYMEKMMGITK